MGLSNTPSAYGSLAKLLHWLTLLLMMAVIPLGVIAHGLEIGPDTLTRKARLFSLHKTLGLALFFTALIRILWALVQPKPAALHPDRKLEDFLARMVHWLLYSALVIVPLSGWVHHAATEGYAPIWWPFGQSLPFVPIDANVAAISAGLHVIFQRVLMAAILLHVMGALKHHLFDRDDTLRRMLPGRRDIRAPSAGVTKGNNGLFPFLGALVIWALALGIGAQLGVLSRDSQAAQIATLEEVETGWDVQEGTLSLAVSQFGSRVEGSFGDWTAGILFNEEPDAEGRFGSVDVQIAIGSLTLGSVTSQALGADFFNADGFPTARYTADIFANPDGGYLAEGMLTLKGNTIDVPLAFTLAMEGDIARMSGTAQLDRRDFGIGTGYDDESTVGFTVDVGVDLTAKQLR